jgi:hypothetical protein
MYINFWTLLYNQEQIFDKRNYLPGNNKGTLSQEMSPHNGTMTREKFVKVADEGGSIIPHIWTADRWFHPKQITVVENVL